MPVTDKAVTRQDWTDLLKVMLKVDLIVGACVVLAQVLS